MVKSAGMTWLFLKAAAVGLVLFGGSLSAFAADSDVTLRVASYGGSFTQFAKQFYAEPFTAQTGIKVEFIDASPSTHLAKLIAAKGRDAPYDLVYMDDDVQNQAITAGVLAKIDPKIITNLQFVYPAFQNKDGYGPAFLVTADGIAYNEEEFKKHGIPAPKSWKDLWDPRLAGHVSVPSVDNAMGRVFVIAVAKMAGGNESNLDPAMDQIVSLKAGSYYISSTALEAKFQSGDVWAAPWTNSRAWAMALHKQPIKFVYPSEGGYADMGVVDVTAGSKHKAEANAFINYMLNPVPEIALPFQLRYAPSLSILVDVLKHFPDITEQMPISPEELGKLNHVDWGKFWPQYPQLLETWNHKLLNQ